ncbi:unnamed protein product [Rotaria magnacalcarata]|nr:unnamed protein product [Rotaria magnacalcarata]
MTTQRTRYCAPAKLVTPTQVPHKTLRAQIPAPSTMEHAIRMLLARMTSQHMLWCASVELVTPTLVQQRALCAKIPAPPPPEVAIQMLLAHMTSQHMRWCAPVELVTPTSAQLPALYAKAFLVVITRSETLTAPAAAAAAAVLQSICKVSKQPKSSTRTRQVNSTSKRSPSPPDRIHRSRSKYP